MKSSDNTFNLLEYLINIIANSNNAECLQFEEELPNLKNGGRERLVSINDETVELKKYTKNLIDLLEKYNKSSVKDTFVEVMMVIRFFFLPI